MISLNKIQLIGIPTVGSGFTSILYLPIRNLFVQFVFSKSRGDVIELNFVKDNVIILCFFQYMPLNPNFLKCLYIEPSVF